MSRQYRTRSRTVCETGKRQYRTRSAVPNETVSVAAGTPFSLPVLPDIVIVLRPHIPQMVPNLLTGLAYVAPPAPFTPPVFPEPRPIPRAEVAWMPPNTTITYVRGAQIYYVRNDGNDSNDGLADTAARAWLTITKANTGPSGGYITSDQLVFDGAAGANFSGNLLWTTSGTETARSSISGLNGANIQPSDSYGVRVYKAEFVTVKNLIVTGSGVNASTGVTTSTSAGIDIFDDRTAGSKLRSVYVTGCTVTQCQSGILFRTPIPSDSPTAVVGYVDSRAVSNTVHNVQWYGIATHGGTTWVNAPPNSQPAGVGVFLGVYFGYNTIYSVIGVSGQYAKPFEILNATGGLAERNIVRDSGIVSPPADNSGMMTGPGDHIVYQYNEVKSMGFGIGIDFDIGSTNCQAIGNLTHDCDGASYMDFSGNVGANNLFMNNIGCNDGLRSMETGILFLNGNGTFINNTIIADKNLQVVTGAALIAIGGSGAKPSFYNNIFVAKNGLLLMTGTNDANIVGNNYHTPGGSFSLQVNGVTYTTLAAMQAAGYEKSGGILYGVVGDPLLSAPPTVAFAATLPGAQIGTVTFFDLTSGSPSRGAAVPPEVVGVFPPQRDFHSNPYRTGVPQVVIAGQVDIGAVSYGASALLPGGNQPVGQACQ